MQLFKITALVLIAIGLLSCNSNGEKKNGGKNGDSPNVSVPQTTRIEEDLADNFEWVYVLQIRGVDDAKNRDKIEKKLEETFLKGVNCKKFDYESYSAATEKFVGKKVLEVKIEYSYGHFDLHLQRWKIELEDGAPAILPIEELPVCTIPFAQDLPAFLQEIESKWKEEQKALEGTK